ncbi:glycosyltransferase family 2 protein [candidate division WWE3 bacterium]|nr:glycosyltransferase family 2 protein [candidate division WWE3 bacterium]
MKISVVIPVWNEERFLADCLQSILKQEYPPHEIIVVDNNSTDKSVSIATSFPQVTVLKEKKQGISYTRTTGMNAATGDIIARCDADTTVPPIWTKQIIKTLSEGNYDAVTGPISFYDLPLKTSLFSRVFLKLIKILHESDILLGSNMAITKSMWDKVKANLCDDNPKIHEDIDLTIHIIKEGGKIARDNKMIARTSARRIKNKPLSALKDYPMMLIESFLTHINKDTPKHG